MLVKCPYCDGIVVVNRGVPNISVGTIKLALILAEGDVIAAAGKICVEPSYIYRTLEVAGVKLNDIMKGRVNE